ncbi:pentatricopeptide repeat-containing protein, partial [Tanacetum coccineum]
MKHTKCLIMSAFAWNSLISGYSQMGLYEDALVLYFQIVEQGVEPDGFTFPRVLKLIHVGEQVHREIIRCGYANAGFVLNGLVDIHEGTDSPATNPGYPGRLVAGDTFPGRHVAR